MAVALVLLLPMAWLLAMILQLRKSLAGLQYQVRLAERREPVVQVPPEVQARFSKLEEEIRGVAAEVREARGAAGQADALVRTLVDGQAAAPHLELLGSGFDQFARRVLEERAMASGGDEARWAADVQAVADREMNRFHQSFKTSLAELKERLERKGPTERERSIFNTLVSIRRKAEGALESLRSLQSAGLGAPRFTKQGNGLTFQAWCQRAFANPELVDRSIRDERGLFAAFVEEYSREAARELLASLEASGNGSAGDGAVARLQHWMMDELLAIEDYLQVLESDILDDYDVAPTMRNVVRSVRAALDQVLEALNLRRHPVRLNEDYFEPSLQQITNKIGQDEIVRKVEKHGFSWNDSMVRKAEVWVG